MQFPHHDEAASEEEASLGKVQARAERRRLFGLHLADGKRDGRGNGQVRARRLLLCETEKWAQVDPPAAKARLNRLDYEPSRASERQSARASEIIIPPMSKRTAQVG